MRASRRLSPGMVGRLSHARHTIKVYEDAMQFCLSLQSTPAAPGGDTWVLAWGGNVAVQSCATAGQSALVARGDERLSKALQVKRPAEARETYEQAMAPANAAAATSSQCASGCATELGTVCAGAAAVAVALKALYSVVPVPSVCVRSPGALPQGGAHGSTAMHSA
eukprot:g8288.t1